MKRKVIVMAFTAAIGMSATVAFAAETGAGCGIGKVIFEGKSDKSSNIVASILNDILIPRTFFITTAATMGETILGCDPTTTVMKEEQKRSFVAANMDSLSQEMAQGQGMHLEALASVIGIEQADRQAFFELTQSQYETLFPTSTASAEDVLGSIKTAMLANPELAKYAN